MKLRHAAVITTALVIIAGSVMISPLFFKQNQAQAQQIVMLSFTVSEADNVAGWCQNLSSFLSSYNLPATIFVQGKVAEQNPPIVASFGSKVEFGSLTYDYVNLTSIDDYSLKLWEVEQGKVAVDEAAKINSTIFQAPNGDVDDDIFSILSRSGITADFSYIDHFNVYRNGRFEEIVADIFEADNCSTEYLLNKEVTDRPLIIKFDNTLTVEQVNAFLLSFKAGNYNFVKASELLEIVQSRGY